MAATAPAAESGAVPKAGGQRPAFPPRLRPFDPNFSHADPERWICIYPAYMNKNKSKAEGRLLPKDKAVSDPTYLEIREVLANKKTFQFCIQDKSYPRERSREFNYRGRIKVQLKDDEGNPVDPAFQTSKCV